MTSERTLPLSRLSHDLKMKFFWWLFNSYPKMWTSCTPRDYFFLFLKTKFLLSYTRCFMYFHLNSCIFIGLHFWKNALHFKLKISFSAIFSLRKSAFLTLSDRCRLSSTKYTQVGSLKSGGWVCQTRLICDGMRVVPRRAQTCLYYGRMFREICYLTTEIIMAGVMSLTVYVFQKRDYIIFRWYRPYDGST